MPIRILHIVTYMGRGGLETLLMNCLRHIDREQIQFDFLVHREFRGDYDDEIEALGGKIYRLPRLNPANPGYFRALETFFRSHPEYRIVHCHLDCMSALPLSVAKKCGVPVRIAHSHNANQDTNWKYFLKRFYMKKIPAAATHFFACSQEAGEWMFPGQSVTVVKNGIETDRFCFSSNTRSAVRTELGIQNQLVIGHTGRYMPQKNHTFLLDVFAQIREKNPNALLLLIGEGPMEHEIRQKATALDLIDSVRFLGIRKDIDRMLQAMDVFVMPSLYEGLSLASVEAQASGLPCYFSDTVPRECKLTDTVTFLPLSASPAQWAEEILKADISSRKSGHEAVREAGFDIQNTADFLQDFYRKHW